MRDDLIRAVFKCEPEDLSILDGSGLDLERVVTQLELDGVALSLDSILDEILTEGKNLLKSEWKDRIYGSKSSEHTRCMLRSISPDDDIFWVVHGKDTRVYCHNYKKYKDNLGRALHKFEETTGFKIIDALGG